MKYNKLILIIYLFTFTNCGFKTVNFEGNYHVTEILTKGDNRINFKIKNKILVNSKSDNNNKIKLTIETNKLKNIKEKNINNQITKYEIKIDTKVKYELLDRKVNGEFTISKNGDYNLSSKYSDTLNNEKNLISTLINEIMEDLQENLASKFNDL